MRRGYQWPVRLWEKRTPTPAVRARTQTWVDAHPRLMILVGLILVAWVAATVLSVVVAVVLNGTPGLIVLMVMLALIWWRSRR